MTKETKRDMIRSGPMLGKWGQCGLPEKLA